ncbi:ABC transporter substrate-binding protein [candidate division KSB1 bacterium]|nr:ABC transporter substrate-binding protein [candidate division KSB1 bacterium]
MKILVTYLTALLLACGCSTERRDGQLQENSTGTIQLIFKHHKVAGDPKYMNELLDRFEAENPQIKVEDQTLPASTDEQHQFYITNLEARAPDFDVFALDVIWPPEFAHAGGVSSSQDGAAEQQRGWLLDLTPYFSDVDFSEMIPGPVEADHFEGRPYAVPWYVDAGMLYYRKDLLEKYSLAPPTTFEELASAAKIVLEKENNPSLHGFIWQGRQYEGLVCVVLEYIWGNGGDVIDGTGRVAIADSAAVEALAFMRRLIEEKISPPLVTTADEEMTRHIYSSGRAVFMRNWPYAWSLMQAEGSSVRGKVGITVMPHFQGGESAATLGGWQLGVNRFSQHKDAAVKLVKFLTRRESQKFIALHTGLKPAWKDLYEDPELRAAQPFVAELLPVLMAARPRPVTPYYLMMSQILQAEFSAIITGIKSPKKGLNDARKQIEFLLGQ